MSEEKLPATGQKTDAGATVLAPAKAELVVIVTRDLGAVKRVSQVEADRLIAEDKARLATPQDIAIGG